MYLSKSKTWLVKLFVLAYSLGVESQITVHFNY